MKIFLVPIILFGVFCNCKSQTNETSKVPKWTEADRQYLLVNLIKSKEAILSETKDLTKQQWNFKESPDRWSINQIIEHLCFWELIQLNEISVSLRMGPLPQIPQRPDSIFIDPDPNRLKKNITTDYTKPFTYSVPLGNNEGKNNIIWYTKMREESIDYLKTTKDENSLCQFRTEYSSTVHDVLSPFL